MVFEISIKGAERGISTIKSTLKDGFIGIIQQITGFIEAVDIQIRNVGDACGFFKASGKIGIIIADLCRQLLQGAFTCKILLHKGKYF